MSKRYPFPDNYQSCKDLLFPNELELDDNVYFHGTSLRSALSIIRNGFKIMRQDSCSVSFSKKSSIALGYACGKRNEQSPNGCILAVNIGLVKREYIGNGNDVLHIYCLVTQPEIIGCCIIPAKYKFL